MPIVELRQYTLRPGKRAVLIDLFEAELASAQEDCGIRIVGTFRDLDDESKFVWVRSFPTMDARADSLRSFYGGPVWRGNRNAANATMVDSDDVLLLRPGWDESNFAPDDEPRIGGARAGDLGVVEATILPLADAAGTTDLMYFCDEIAPLIKTAGASVLACLITETSENNFPVLPVREGETTIVWFAGFSSTTAYDRAERRRAKLVEATNRWPGATDGPQVLRLQPTEHSSLTGASSTRFAATHDACSLDAAK